MTQSIYSMALRGGRIAFGPESFPEHDPLASPPGTVYHQPPAELWHVFRAQHSGVVGPYTDEYGTFVSAFVPVLAPRTGKVLLVVGMDLEVGAWQAAIVRARLVPILFTLFTLLIATAGWMMLVWQNQAPAAPQGVWRHIESLLVAIAGLVLTGAVAGLAHRAEIHSRRADFAALAQTQAGSVREVLHNLKGNLDSLARIFEVNPQVDRQAFHAFAEPLIHDGLSQAWAWVPLVPAAARSRVEAQARRDGLTDFAFFEKDARGLRVPVAERADYYPVLYSESLEDDKDVLGFDRGSEPVRRRALEAAAQAGHSTASDPVTLIQQSDSQQGILIDRPVFTTAAKERRLLGFASAVVRLESVIRYPLNQAGNKQPLVEMDLFQLDIDKQPRFLASSSLTEAWRHRSGKSFQQARTGDLAAVFPLFIFGKAYALVIHPDPAFLALDPMWDGWITGVGGLLLTAVLSSFVGFLTTRRDDLERQVLVRTAELRQSESRMRAITDSAQDAILMMDPEGRISYWNPAAERIFGYAGTEALGLPLHEILVPERYRAVHLGALPAFLQTGQGAAIGKTLELHACRKDGEEIAVAMSLSAVQIGGTWHAVSILRDETERKRAEEALRETNRQLELATALAQDMTARAELANAAKSQFLANMSHEIRTPMNGIIGMAGVLLDTGLGPEQRQYAEIVRASGEMLLELINNILDFSKIEALKLELEILDFDLRLVLEDTIEMLAARAQQKGLELACLMDPGVPTLLKGDPGRLRQILINLVGNAIKFTPGGEVSVRVSLIEEHGGWARLRFAVRDTGIGIPRDKLPILFSPFTQADESTTRKYGGTGLGLAISRQLAELMGGQIGVESVEDQGSTFWFTARLERQTGPALTFPLAPADWAGMKVLVVDGHETSRLSLATLLGAWDCQVAGTADGEAALAALREAATEGVPFRVAFIDMLLPGLDGAALCRAIKSHEALRDTILIVMAPLTGFGVAGHLEHLGLSGYLTKPLRQAQLRDCLAKALDRNALPAASPASITPDHSLPDAESGKRHARILLAEDNPTNQLVALKILEKLGYRADAVANGQEAITALQSIPYDLVLMDCQMPNLDGFEATRRIRAGAAGARNAALPIIAMTAHALKGDRERCLEAGMSDYLSKPVHPGALAEMLERWLDGGQSAAPEPSSTPVALEAHAPAAREVIFDREAFMERVMGDERLALLLIETFLADLAAQESSLARAVEAGDCRQAGKLAHKLKGAASNLGAQALQDVAAALEEAGKANDPVALGALLPRLKAQSVRLGETLRAVLNGRSSPAES